MTHVVVTSDSDRRESGSGPRLLTDRHGFDGKPGEQSTTVRAGGAESVEIGESEKAEESEVSTDREEKEMTGGIKIVSEQNLGSYVTLHPTNTTNTFTPTTLKTIEQMFVDVEEPESYKNQAGFAPPTLKHKTYINMDSSNWQQGGVTTVVTPSAAPPPSFELLQPSNQEEEKKVNRGGGRKPRDKEEETLCPEEEERRKMRRERNKLAAARCRKRRVDQTESLQDEVNLWEGKKKALQEQIQQLQEEKNQLEFILEAHKSVCSRVSSESALDVKPITTTEPRVLVKAEPELQQSTVRHLTHAEAMEEQQAVTVTTTVRVAQKPKRPSSLLVGNGSNSLSSLNIPIETPTNVMNQLDFNALMDGRTGLTPTNILTPIMVNMTTSSSSSSSGLLQTPTVSTPSCGSQQRTNRSAVLQELGSPNTGGHLVSL